jgi:hypothetical protein
MGSPVTRPDVDGLGVSVGRSCVGKVSYFWRQYGRVPGAGTGPFETGTVRRGPDGWTPRSDDARLSLALLALSVSTTTESCLVTCPPRVAQQAHALCRGDDVVIALGTSHQ